MFIGEISKTIKTPFEYAFLDEDGEYKSVTVDVWVKRLTFRESSAKAFQEQFQAIDKDIAKLAEVTPPLIADWEFFDDEECTQKSPRTAEWLLDRPPGFVMQLAECVFTRLQTLDPKEKPANSVDGSAPTVRLESRATN